MVYPGFKSLWESSLNNSDVVNHAGPRFNTYNAFLAMNHKNIEHVNNKKII